MGPSKKWDSADCLVEVVQKLFCGSVCMAALTPMPRKKVVQLVQQEALVENMTLLRETV